MTEIPRDELERLVKLVRETGNPQRGEAVFRRAETLCLRCHAISGAGGQVGPDMTSLGASAQIDYLVESILVPNKAVKENYHSLVIETKSGKVLNGVKIRENGTELVLRNAEDVELSIPIADIEERVNGGSIMPAGLTDTLTEQELIDLVRFLSCFDGIQGIALKREVADTILRKLPDLHERVAAIAGTSDGAAMLTNNRPRPLDLGSHTE